MLLAEDTKQWVAQESKCPSTTSFPTIIFRMQTLGDSSSPAERLKKARAWKVAPPVLNSALAEVVGGPSQADGSRSLFWAEYF